MGTHCNIPYNYSSVKKKQKKNLATIIDVIDVERQNAGNSWSFRRGMSEYVLQSLSTLAKQAVKSVYFYVCYTKQCSILQD